MRSGRGGPPPPGSAADVEAPDPGIEGSGRPEAGSVLIAPEGAGVEGADPKAAMGFRERLAKLFSSDVEEKEFREIPLNDANVGDTFVNNRVKTSRYTLITFLPKNLFEQLRKVGSARDIWLPAYSF